MLSKAQIPPNTRMMIINQEITGVLTEYSPIFMLASPLDNHHR
jgi:hypothetical protein